jgi:hypothetical protein
MSLLSCERAGRSARARLDQTEHAFNCLRKLRPGIIVEGLIASPSRYAGWSPNVSKCGWLLLRLLAGWNVCVGCGDRYFLVENGITATESFRRCLTPTSLVNSSRISRSLLTDTSNKSSRQTVLDGCSSRVGEHPFRARDRSRALRIRSQRSEDWSDVSESRFFRSRCLD